MHCWLVGLHFNRGLEEIGWGGIVYVCMHVRMHYCSSVQEAGSHRQIVWLATSASGAIMFH
jgi:hypothetical protein